jgi:hypothetical protein
MKRVIIIMIGIVAVSLVCAFCYGVLSHFPLKLGLPLLVLLALCFLFFSRVEDPSKYRVYRILVWMARHYSPASYHTLPPMGQISSRPAAVQTFLKKHSELIRSLSRTHISSVDIAFATSANARIQEPQLIASFKKYLSGTMVRLSLPDAISKYGDQVQELTLQIQTEEGTVSYAGIVHPKCPDDIILIPPERNDCGGIHLAGLKRWLDENVLNT